ncbi:MAG: McrC family protein [Clostridia bacterium]|nr:McrC family protein [Clostridia bacterium]
MDVIKIREYSAFRVGERNGEYDGHYTTLTEKTFNALEQFVLSCKNDKNEAVEVMNISARRGIGKIISAKNYVGVITMSNGTTIEILPKIYSAEYTDEDKQSKEILIRMLRTLYNMPSITLQSTSLDTSKMPLLEIFIRMFIDEVLKITRSGLKSSYETVEENATFFKGKLKFAEHIRKNFVHKERNYISYDAFTVNRPENRILKTALQFLYLHTCSSKNKTDIKNMLTVFEDVELSIDYKNDLAKITLDRNTKGYTTAIEWAKVFLSGKSFTSFSGSEIALALLFPMDKLFECYIASLVKKDEKTADYKVSTQHTGYYLFDKPQKTFNIRPDIVISENKSYDVFVFDTKWKILDKNNNHYGISQGDMYQMYVYQKKYGANSVTLLYPLSHFVSRNENIEYTTENGSVVVKVKFIDLLKAKEDVSEILGEVLSD